MPKQGYFDITIILDRSGSMGVIRKATIDGINSFILEQQKIPGDGCWSLIQFDDKYEVNYSAVPEKNVPLLTFETFVPRGWTALVDAVCRTIDDTGIRLAATPEHLRPSKVLMVIMTDGEENFSTKFTKQDLAERIQHQRDVYGWSFLFLGANQDAIATAHQYNIKAANSSRTYEHNTDGVLRAFNAVNNGTRQWKLDGNQSAAQLLDDPIPVNVTVNVNSQQPVGVVA